MVDIDSSLEDFNRIISDGGEPDIDLMRLDAFFEEVVEAALSASIEKNRAIVAEFDAERQEELAVACPLIFDERPVREAFGFSGWFASLTQKSRRIAVSTGNQSWLNTFRFRLGSARSLAVAMSFVIIGFIAALSVQSEPGISLRPLPLEDDRITAKSMSSFAERGSESRALISALDKGQMKIDSPLAVVSVPVDQRFDIEKGARIPLRSATVQKIDGDKHALDQAITMLTRLVYDTKPLCNAGADCSAKGLPYESLAKVERERLLLKASVSHRIRHKLPEAGATAAFCGITGVNGDFSCYDAGKPSVDALNLNASSLKPITFQWSVTTDFAGRQRVIAVAPLSTSHGTLTINFDQLDALEKALVASQKGALQTVPVFTPSAETSSAASTAPVDFTALDQ